MAHKRLAKIQEQNLYDVEGGTPTSFMKLLRHECGHAIDNAYRLRRKRLRQKVFGKSTVKYDDFYVPKPFSKKYVVHLDAWYSQSHPDEDFAETFAVWLSPRSKWQKRYKNWKGALKKLEYMDSLMAEVGSQKPPVRTRKKIDIQSGLTQKLGDFYQEKREHYGMEYPDVYDLYLFKLFTNNPAIGQKIRAATFIRKIRKEARKSISPWTGAYQYTINQVIEEIIERSSELNLRLRFPEEESKNQFISMLSVITLEYIHSGNHKIAR